MDESQPARSISVSDGRMIIDGVPERYVQNPSRPCRLAATRLRFVRGYAGRDGRLETVQRIEGQARILGGALRRAGLESADAPLRLTLQPLATASEQQRLLVILGWREGAEGEEAFADILLPPAVFDALKADLAAGLAQELAIAATTSLWIREDDRGLPAGEPLDWYLGLEEDGWTSAPARGFVESLEWQARPAEPETDPAAEPVPIVTPAAPEDEIEGAADQLRRINWSLKQLLLLLAFLLIIVAVK